MTRSAAMAADLGARVRTGSDRHVNLGGCTSQAKLGLEEMTCY